MSESIYDTQGLPGTAPQLYFIVNLLADGESWQYMREADYEGAVRQVHENMMSQNMERMVHGVAFVHTGQMAVYIHEVPVQLMVMYTGEDTEAAFNRAIEHIGGLIAATK